jgi:hypothetical protein
MSAQIAAPKPRYELVAANEETGASWMLGHYNSLAEASRFVFSAQAEGHWPQDASAFLKDTVGVDGFSLAYELQGGRWNELP